MEESKTSASKKPEVPVYLVVGDTGVGKSTFVNNILGAYKAHAPISNKEGHSVTVGAQIYSSETLPLFSIIDTQGTNDTKNPDNNAILRSIFYRFIAGDNFPTDVNGIIYLHDSNIVARCHFDLRC